MITMTASEARAKFENLIEQVGGSHRPVRIVGNRNSSILVSADHGRSMDETLYLLSVPGMCGAIHEARARPLTESAKTLDW